MVRPDEVDPDQYDEPSRRPLHDAHDSGEIFRLDEPAGSTHGGPGHHDEHAVTQRVDQEQEGPVVYLENGSARSVTLGNVGEDRVVIEEGIMPGDVVLLARPGDQEDDDS